MTKKELIAIFTAQIEEEVRLITAAALATHDAATNEESKAENQYDTRGLEASYLAGAQAKRVQEMKEVLGLFLNLNFRDFGPNDTVQATALVDILLDGKKSKLLVMPKGGGVSLKLDNENIQIITPASALGENLIGLRLGEVAEFEVGPKVRVVEITALS